MNKKGFIDLEDFNWVGLGGGLIIGALTFGIAGYAGYEGFFGKMATALIGVVIGYVLVGRMLGE